MVEGDDIKRVIFYPRYSDLLISTVIIVIAVIIVVITIDCKQLPNKIQPVINFSKCPW